MIAYAYDGDQDVFAIFEVDGAGTKNAVGGVVRLAKASVPDLGADAIRYRAFLSEPDRDIDVGMYRTVRAAIDDLLWWRAVKRLEPEAKPKTRKRPPA